MLIIPLVLTVLFEISNAALPNGWKACKMSSSNFNDCLMKEIDNAIKTLKNGDKKLGILPLEPLTVKKLVLRQGSGPISLMITATDLEFHGLTSGKFQSLVNRDWKIVNSSTFFDKITVKGKYKGEGKILAAPITGEGQMTVISTDSTSKQVHTFKTIEKKGKKYLQTKEFKVDSNPKKVVFNFENLFNGNKELGDNMNKFINENWQEIWAEMKGPIDKTLSAALSSVADSILGKIPVNEFIVK